MAKDFSDRLTLLITFGYDGGRFYGLQAQPDRPTAGAALAARLEAAAGRKASGLVYAARTDRGVSALENRATCYFRKLDVPPDVIRQALLTDTKDGLWVRAVDVVPPTVHARGEARGKHYRYRVEDGAAPDALLSLTAWRVVPPLDLAPMRAAAAQLTGTHDFSSLRGAGCTAAETTKTLRTIAVHRRADAVTIDVVGDAFLRKMVRNLVGLLVEVGTGWRPAAQLPAVLAARHRQAAGLCAPPEGLTLVRVGFGWPPSGDYARFDLEE
jgi:tRNA pseudouridine38-40 synthase